MTTTIDKITAASERLERARELYKGGAVEKISDGIYVVISQSDGFYTISEGQCSCPDYQYRYELNHGLCKHRLAAMLFQEEATKE